MRFLSPHGLWRTTSAGLLLAFTTVALAGVTGLERRADGLAIYLGVVPAQLLRGNADSSHLPTMHGGLPAASGTHHLVIAIYDERTQWQVEGADVAARVTPLGLGPTRRKLEPMQIGTSATYGNFFPTPGPGPYTIQVTIRVPGEARTTEVQFNYSHPR